MISQENWRDGKSLAHPSCRGGLCPRLNCSAGHRKLAALLVGLVGCLVGCRSGSEDQLSAEQLDKQRQERTADVLANDPVSLPTDSQRAIVTLKPGHWHEVTQKFRSNREDLQVLAVGSVLRGGGPSPLAGTDFVGEFTRRSTLPKEQEKTLALQVFAASGGQAGQNQSSTIAGRNRIDLASQLFALPLKTPISGGNRRTAAYELADHEFQLVVLSPEALGYQYLSSLDAIVWAQTDENLVTDRIRSYEVCLLTPRNRQYGLPSSLLTMTSVAVIVWDDVIPDELTDDQRQAMLDWLHWGGQLVISGPTSWSRLQNSFLSPYLPATSAAVTDLTDQSFAPLSARWITQDHSLEPRLDPIAIVGEPVSGLQFTLSPSGQWLPDCGELVAESRVGRGRIVLAGFPLREPRIYSWPYFSSFFSTGLLRRWPRDISMDVRSNQRRQAWVGPFATANTDPRLHSNLRLLTRDVAPLARKTGPEGTQAASAESSDHRRSSRISEASYPASGAGEYEPVGWGSAAVWGGYTGLTMEAIDALRDAAGISLPSRATILRLMGGYLCLLIPLNYVIFRLLGRLEFAWLAVPALAVLGVVVVGKVTQLDIGFARRSTEIAVLELYNNHRRGHLTRYAALYSSLSTNYSIEVPGHGSAVLPLGDARREPRRTSFVPRLVQLNWGRSDGVELDPLTVYSNSTEMIRAEQMVDLASPMRWVERAGAPPRLVNAGDFALERGLVLGRRLSGEWQSAWLEDLPAGGSQSIQWSAASFEQALAVWEERPETSLTRMDASVADRPAGIWIGGLIQQIACMLPITRGQVVLIGYTRDSLGGLKLTPVPDRHEKISLVVAHLACPPLGDVHPDQGIVSQIIPEELPELQPIESVEED